MRRPWVHLATVVALVAASSSLLSTWADATPICRWVDDSGRTQLSEVVPERHQASASCTDSSRYELSPSQQRDARHRLEQERARVVSAAATPPARPASAAPPRAASAPEATLKRPAEAVTDATDCATWWRLYDESGACFGPFRTVRGGIKAEAFDMCNAIANPEPKCGPRSQ